MSILGGAIGAGVGAGMGASFGQYYARLIGMGMTPEDAAAMANHMVATAPSGVPGGPPPGNSSTDPIPPASQDPGTGSPPGGPPGKPPTLTGGSPGTLDPNNPSGSNGNDPGAGTNSRGVSTSTISDTGLATSPGYLDPNGIGQAPATLTGGALPGTPPDVGSGGGSGGGSSGGGKSGGGSGGGSGAGGGVGQAGGPGSTPASGKYTQNADGTVSDAQGNAIKDAVGIDPHSGLPVDATGNTYDAAAGGFSADNPQVGFGGSFQGGTNTGDLGMGTGQVNNGALGPLGPGGTPSWPAATGASYDANGNWTPNPSNGPSGSTQPDPTKGMTAEQLAAYRAKQQYNNNGLPQQGMSGDPNLNGYQSPQGQTVPSSGGSIGGGGMGGGFPTNPNAYLNPGLFNPAPLDKNGQQFLGNVFSSFQDAQNKANAANAGMYNNVNQGYNQLGASQASNLGGLAGLYGNRTNDFASGAGNVLQNYGNLLNSQTQGLGNIGGGYNQLLNNQMSRLGLLGQTEANDINQQYGQQQAQAQQGLVDRGLGNTTVTNAVNRGINLDQTRALTNNAQNVAAKMNQTEMGAALPGLQFNERAVGQEGNIAGQGLQAQQNFLPQIAGLQGQALDFGNQANQQQTQLGQNQLNFMQGVNQTGPDFNTLAQLATAIGTGGTGPGQNGFNNLPTNFPSQAPVGPLPGANLTPLNYQPGQQQMQPNPLPKPPQLMGQAA